MSDDERTESGANICIGILAHNEQDAVGAMLEQLFEQTIITKPGDQIGNVHVVALPNGCTDDTASIIKSSFTHAPDLPHLTLQLDERVEAGKSRTWNHFVHCCSPPEADVLVLLDADIGLPQRTAIEQTVTTLLDRPAANVAIDKILKSAATTGPKTLGDRISVLASRASNKQAPIAGSLYAIRAEAARGIWMPAGLAVEDGFVRAMVLTDRFTHDEDLERIVVASNAFHTFEAESSLGDFLRHERRLIVGTMLNVYLFEYLWDRSAESEIGDLGIHIRDRNNDDPLWLATICHDRIRAAGRWVIPLDAVFKRVISLRRLPLAKRVAYLPLAVASTVPQAIACVLANRTLRKGEGLGYW